MQNPFAYTATHSFDKTPQFTVVENFDPSKLSKTLQKASGNSKQIVETNSIYNYLAGYFKDPDSPVVKTVICENNYVDKYYIDDFSGYYVRCFRHYTRNCVRLHFFNHVFDKEELNSFLEGNNNYLKEKLEENFIGFVVVKKLPLRFIGRTCLQTYKAINSINGNPRYFPIKRDYIANLFGLSLKVNTLAFQEQDKTISACATSALWVAFSGTGILFNHAIPSPLKITATALSRQFGDNATKYPNDDSNQSHFPSDGLGLTQMNSAVLNVGLHPTALNIEEKIELQNLITGYLKAKIPLILIVDVYDLSDIEELKKCKKDKYDEYCEKCKNYKGAHAIVVTGYGIDNSIDLFSLEHQAYEIKTEAEKISKIYCHDDQVGPFARMNFVNFPCKKTGKKENNDQLWLTSSFLNRRNERKKVFVKPFHVIVPVYKKIRVTYERIYAVIVFLSGKLVVSNIFRTFDSGLNSSSLLKPHIPC